MASICTTLRRAMSIPAKTGTDVRKLHLPHQMLGLCGLGCLVIIARQHGLHLSTSQLIHDNGLTGKELSVPDLLKCARSAGLKARSLHLKWSALTALKKALPAIVVLHGCSMVVLRDPNGSDDALLVIDRVRFEHAWTGEVVLVKRNYEISDESQPFSISLVAALIFRERWIIRDIAVCALVLSVLALTPIIFWRLLTDKVLYFKAYNTFFVLCLAMVVLVAFETVFACVRQFLDVHLTTRVDIKLATYLFDKLLNLPIDFFERTQVGRVTHEAHQIWKIRTFLMGQLFGTVLDSVTILIFVPVMFFYSPILTAIVLASCALIVVWLIVMLPYHRRRSAAVEAAEAARGAFLVQTIHGIRTVKSLALEAGQRRAWEVLTARVAKLRFAEGVAANLIYSVVR